MKLKGEWVSRKAWIDGKRLFSGKSQKQMNHSPDGFNWGYGGSGPAQLALAVLLEIFPKKTLNYQQFKWDIIAKLPSSDFEVDLDISKLKDYVD